MKAVFRYASAALLAGQAAALGPGVVMPFLQNNAEVPSNSKLSEEGSSRIKAYNLSVPVDHFHNESKYEPHSDDFFNLRYWLDTSFYRPGGPVIVLHSGEFSSEGRLPYLEHGIANILANATGGVALVMEHRYYGTSWPVPNTTLENMRFLDTEQALADTAYFAQHITFPGLEHVNLTSEHAPWVIYGGSYAGAFAALTRKLYPDVYWGGISSSGVPMVIEDFWQYFEAFRYFAPEGCSEVTQKLVHVVDNILFSGKRDEVCRLKELFHLGELEDDEFGSAITAGSHGLQGTNWDPAEDNADLGYYCAAVTSTAQLFASTRHLHDAARHFVKLGGYGHEVDVLEKQFVNFLGTVRDRVKKNMKSCEGKSQRECFSNRFSTVGDGIEEGFIKSWTYQTCTQWGYFINGASVPEDRLPLISRAVTLEYATTACRNWFNITTSPDVASINKHGGFDFSYPRLAFIDGRQDPWRAAGVHAMGQPDRKSTTSEPFEFVDWGVHHWEEFGLKEGVTEEGLPPRQVVDSQQQQIKFVKAWLKEWDEKHGKNTEGGDDDRNDL